MERRLAAILAADVVGYSTLMGMDEARTLAALRQLRHDLLAPAVTEYRGNLVKSMGDGWLVEFPSAGDAVAFAIRLQDTLIGHETIKLRVGLHIGDVTFEDEDIYGDGVNIASRLQELASPGAIVISDSARRSIDGKLAANFNDIGLQELKNITEQVRAYARGMGIAGDKAARIEDALLHLPDKPSIAVLPFDNMSSDPEQEYFSDGITEDLITALSRMKWLFIIARNSSFVYKGRAVDVAQVGRDLGVRYILEGSVRKVGDRVRITTQLVEAANGNHVWAERYDRGMDDIFDLQDEITEVVAGRIDTEVRRNEITHARGKRPRDMKAWDLYLRGLWHNHKITDEGTTIAREWYRKALDADPDYALAWAGLAYSYSISLLNTFPGNREEMRRLGLEAGEKALALDSEDWFVLYTYGRMLVLTGRLDEACATMERAVEFGPSAAYAHYGLGMARAYSGDAKAARNSILHALLLSPQDTIRFGMYSFLATASLALKEYENAESWARKTINANPTFWQGHVNLIVALAYQGKMNEAKSLASEVSQKFPQVSIQRWSKVIEHSRKPRLHKEWFGLLRRAGLPD